MKTERFLLERPTKLIPLTGCTEVTITTNGGYCKRTQDKRRSREKKVVLTATKRARLILSPQGNSMTMVIHLPTEEANFSNYIEEATELYGKYLRTCEIVN